MGICGRDPNDHCCWVNGKPCKFLKTTSGKKKREGFYWKCQLREEHGNWEDVHTDPRYLKEVKPEWERVGIKTDCGGWPQTEGVTCGLCGDE